MKSIKILCLAALGTGLMLFTVYAGAASATVLCAKALNPCGGEDWGVNTEIETSLEPGASSRLTAPGGTPASTCGETTFKIKTTSTGGAEKTVTGSVLKAWLTWSDCTSTTSTVEGGNVEIHSIANSVNGTITGTGVKVTTVLAGASCVYGFGDGVDLGTFTGGMTPVIDINASMPRQEGGVLCPASIVWTSTYRVTSPTKAFYVEPK